MAGIELEIEPRRHRQPRQQRVRQGITVDEMLLRPGGEPVEADAALNRYLLRSVAEAEPLTHPGVVREISKRAVGQEVRELMQMAVLVADAILRAPRPAGVIRGRRLDRASGVRTL